MTAIKYFEKALLKQFVRTQRLSVGLGEEPSAYMIESLRKSDKEYKEGNTSPSFAIRPVVK